MRVLLSTLNQAASERAEGYLEDVLSVSKVDGEFVDIPSEEYTRIATQYRKVQDPTLPSFPRMAANYVGAKAKDILAGSPRRTTEQIEQIMAICDGCQFLRSDKRCSKCGCPVAAKAISTIWHCPVGKW